jgi:hypothetical protein
LSTFALEGSDAAGTDGRSSVALRYADLALLALALPAFVVAGWPLVGYGAIAAAWLAQHVILVAAGRRSTAASLRGDRRAALGIFAAATLGRVWLVTATILVVGLVGARADGLAAAVLAAALITVHLAAKVLTRLLEGEEGGRAR